MVLWEGFMGRREKARFQFEKRKPEDLSRFLARQIAIIQRAESEKELLTAINEVSNSMAKRTDDLTDLTGWLQHARAQLASVFDPYSQKDKAAYTPPKDAEQIFNVSKAQIIGQITEFQNKHNSIQ